MNKQNNALTPSSWRGGAYHKPFLIVLALISALVLAWILSPVLISHAEDNEPEDNAPEAITVTSDTQDDEEVPAVNNPVPENPEEDTCATFSWSVSDLANGNLNVDISAKAALPVNNAKDKSCFTIYSVEALVDSSYEVRMQVKSVNITNSGDVDTLNIAYKAFAQRSDNVKPLLTSIIFPENLKTLNIGHEAFEQSARDASSTSLRYVEFPEGLQNLYVGIYAFNQGTDGGASATLSSIHFPNSLINLDLQAGSFSQMEEGESGPTALVAVEFPQGLKTLHIGTFAFGQFSNIRTTLSAVEFPVGIEHLIIDDNAFFQMSAGEQVSFKHFLFDFDEQGVPADVQLGENITTIIDPTMLPDGFEGLSLSQVNALSSSSIRPYGEFEVNEVLPSVPWAWYGRPMQPSEMVVAWKVKTAEGSIAEIDNPPGYTLIGRIPIEAPIQVKLPNTGFLATYCVILLIFATLLGAFLRIRTKKTL